MGFFERVLPNITTDLEKFSNIKENENTTEFGEDSVMDSDAITSSYSIYNQFSTNFDDTNAASSIDDLIISWRKMSDISYVQNGIEEIINSSIPIQTYNNKPPVEIEFNDVNKNIEDKLKAKIIEEWENLLDIIDFDYNGDSYFKQWYIDGRLIMQTILYDKKSKINNGIQKVKIMSPLEIKRVWDDDKKRFYYEYKKGEKKYIIPDELIVYVSSGLYDYSKKYPISYLHTAYKDVSRLNILEDHMLIYRITRAAERRVYYIDAGNMPPKMAENHLKDVIRSHKQNKIFDENTGSLSSKVKHPSMLEDIFLLRRGSKNTEISTLQAGEGLNNIEDLFYFQRKAANALHVPFSKLNWEDRDGNANISPTVEDITREEYKFHKFIIKLQRSFSQLFYELLYKQLIFKNIIKQNEWESIKRKIIFRFNNENHFIEAKKAKTLESKLRALSDIDSYVGNWFSKKYVYENILNISETEIQTIKNQIETEKTEDGDDNNRGW